MNTPCPFEQSNLSFSGPPIAQARCLLRFVKRGGNIDDNSAVLPRILERLLSAPQALNLTVAQLRAYLQKHGIPESTVGGSLDDPICRADSNNPAARLAQYFVIHDTSSKLHGNQTFDPNFINTASWAGNNLANLARGRTHMYITRLGETLTDRDYGTPFRATQFEIHRPHTLYRGLFLHHELIQPRMGSGTSDIESPNPGFTQVQLERLALQYLIASVRRGSWMIPGFHCVIDLHIGDHDDPQRFDLAAWGLALETMLAAVGAGQTVGDERSLDRPAVRLRSELLSGDAILQEVANGIRVFGPSQVRSLAGVGTLQDALNFLADHGEPGLSISGARSGSKGFYGQQTKVAVQFFQSQHHLAIDPVVGRETILTLDVTLLRFETTIERLPTQPLGQAKETFSTPAASAKTKNGRGGSTTTGLQGNIFEPDALTEVIDASETLMAFREGHKLGPERTVRQIRTSVDGKTTVHQPDYAWGKRVLPDATLEQNHPGFDAADATVFRGRATFFGKSDDIDEGTGSGAFGLIQTNSSVFGVSLKQSKLVREGLVAVRNHVFEATEEGLQAMVEIYFPKTKRLARLPIVDVGPAEKIKAIADLTVAAAVFLQKLSEDELTKPGRGQLDNITVQARIVT